MALLRGSTALPQRWPSPTASPHAVRRQSRNVQTPLSCHSPQGAPALFQTELGARHAHRKILSMFCVPFRSKRWRCRAAPNQLASRAERPPAPSSPAGVGSSSPGPGRSQNLSSSLSPSPRSCPMTLPPPAQGLLLSWQVPLWNCVLSCLQIQSGPNASSKGVL